MTPDLPGTLVIGVITLSLMSLALCLHLGRRPPHRRRTRTGKAPHRNKVSHPDATIGFRDPYR